MGENLRSWQRSAIRNQVSQYRQALENYYIKNKQIIQTDSGPAFSLLSPPIASAASRRRLRYIVSNLVAQNKGADPGDNLGSRTPHFVTIAVTYDCQCDCLHCSSSEYKKEVQTKQPCLNTQELKDIVRNTIKLGTTSIVFTGGEPLLKKYIYALIRTVDRSKAVCTVFTNGEYLTEETVKKLKQAGAYGVFVSLDFADGPRHDQNRARKGIFLKALEGIKRAQKYGLLTGISTYVTHEKIKSGELDRLMELGKELNVLEVFIFDVIPVGKLDGDRQCLMEEDDFEWIREFRKRYNEKSDYPRIIHQTMLTSIAYPCTGEGCPAAVAQMHIRANGDVSPCDFTPLSFGNVRRKPLKEIWQEMSSNRLYAKASSSCRLSDGRMWERLKEASGERS